MTNLSTSLVCVVTRPTGELVFVDDSWLRPARKQPSPAHVAGNATRRRASIQALVTAHAMRAHLKMGEAK